MENLMLVGYFISFVVWLIYFTLSIVHRNNTPMQYVYTNNMSISCVILCIFNLMYQFIT